MKRFAFHLLLSLAVSAVPRVSLGGENGRCQEETLHILENLIGSGAIAEVVDHSCKRSPSNGNLIAAVAYKPQGYEEFDNLPFLVALFENNAQPIATYSGKIVVDATVNVQEGSLEIDTGRYNLGPGIRAIGLRIHATRTPKCAEATTDDELTLFIQEGNKLRPVFGPTPTYYSVARDGAFCTEGVIVDDWKMLLSITDRQFNGLRDIFGKFVSSTAKDITCTFRYSPKGRNYHADKCYVAHIPVF